MTQEEMHSRGAGLAHPRHHLRALENSGEAEAEFTAFFLAEYPRTVRTLYLVLHDQGHAEEIAQDAFVELLKHWTTIVDYDQPGAWLRRVAIRMAVRTVKRERTRALLERRSHREVEVAAEPSGPPDEVKAAVRALPTNQRVAIVLFYFEDQPVAEIASALGCAPATARVHLHKARKRLAAVLGEEVDDVVG